MKIFARKVSDFTKVVSTQSSRFSGRMKKISKYKFLFFFLNGVRNLRDLSEESGMWVNWSWSVLGLCSAHVDIFGPACRRLRIRNILPWLVQGHFGQWGSKMGPKSHDRWSTTSAPLGFLPNKITLNWRLRPPTHRFAPSRDIILRARRIQHYGRNFPSPPHYRKNRYHRKMLSQGAKLK